jgi:hypothetical protein
LLRYVAICCSRRATTLSSAVSTSGPAGGVERVVGRLAGDLDAVALTDSRVALADHLDLESLHQWPTPSVESPELVLGGESDLVGDANSSSFEDKIHTSGV